MMPAANAPVAIAWRRVMRAVGDASDDRLSTSMANTGAELMMPICSELSPAR